MEDLAAATVASSPTVPPVGHQMENVMWRRYALDAPPNAPWTSTYKMAHLVGVVLGTATMAHVPQETVNARPSMDQLEEVETAAVIITMSGVISMATADQQDPAHMLLALQAMSSVDRFNVPTLEINSQLSAYLDHCNLALMAQLLLPASPLSLLRAMAA